MQHSEEQVHNLERKETMADRPGSTDEQSQGQDPSTQTKPAKISVYKLLPIKREKRKGI